MLAAAATFARTAPAGPPHPPTRHALSRARDWNSRRGLGRASSPWPSRNPAQARPAPPACDPSVPWTPRKSPCARAPANAAPSAGRPAVQKNRVPLNQVTPVNDITNTPKAPAKQRNTSQVQCAINSTHNLTVLLVILDLPVASFDLMLQSGLKQPPLIGMVEGGGWETHLAHRCPDVPEDPGRAASIPIATCLVNAAELAHKRQNRPCRRFSASARYR
jgi:hypothetical protein